MQFVARHHRCLWPLNPSIKANQSKLLLIKWNTSEFMLLPVATTINGVSPRHRCSVLFTLLSAHQKRLNVLIAPVQHHHVVVLAAGHLTTLLTPIHRILLRGQMAPRVQLLEHGGRGRGATAPIGNPIAVLLGASVLLVLMHVYYVLVAVVARVILSAALVVSVGKLLLLVKVLLLLLDLGVDDLDFGRAVGCQHASLGFLGLRAIVEVVLQWVRVGAHDWLLLDCGDHPVVGDSLAWLSLRSDLLCQHFTLFCANEPGVE